MPHLGCYQCCNSLPLCMQLHLSEFAFRCSQRSAAVRVWCLAFAAQHMCYLCFYLPYWIEDPSYTRASIYSLVGSTTERKGDAAAGPAVATRSWDKPPGCHWLLEASGTGTALVLLMLLSFRVECMAARLAAMSTSRWWLRARLPRLLSPVAWPAALLPCCWARLLRDTKPCGAALPGLPRRAELLPGRKLLCVCMPACAARGAVLLRCTLPRARRAWTIALDLICSRTSGVKIPHDPSRVMTGGPKRSTRSLPPDACSCLQDSPQQAAR